MNADQATALVEALKDFVRAATKALTEFAEAVSRLVASLSRDERHALRGGAVQVISSSTGAPVAIPLGVSRGYPG